MARALVVLVALVAGLVATEGRAQGGPPLMTDDPDTPGDGHWEINIGATTQAAPQATAGDLVHVDLNYGLGSRIQLKYETGYSYELMQNERVEGMGDSLVGVKYRFYETGTETEGYRISVYPQAETRGPFGAQSRWLTTSETLYYLPVEFKAGFGAVALTADLGRELGAQGAAGWFGGVAAGYTPVDHVELIAEVHDQTDARFPLQGRLVQAGARLEASETLAVMFAIGRLASEPPVGLGTVGYLGVKLNF